MTEYTVDAKGRSIGRVASEAAVLLMGKNVLSYSRNKVPSVSVKIVNASKANITALKMKKKIYKDFSGYPGGQKETSMAHLVEKKGYTEVFKRAVKGMLPHNKLQNSMMKNLEISE